MQVKGIMVWVLNTEELKFGKREGSIMESRSCLGLDERAKAQFSVKRAWTILAENGLGA